MDYFNYRYYLHSSLVKNDAFFLADILQLRVQIIITILIWPRKELRIIEAY